MLLESINSPQDMEFFNQWTKRPQTAPQEFTEPTCTVPNQSMTVQQIIAKYSRTGLVPQSFAHKDQGGNVATDPDFDPLDQAFEVMDAASAASHGSGKEPSAPSLEPEPPSAPAGEGE